MALCRTGWSSRAHRDLVPRNVLDPLDLAGNVRAQVLVQLLLGAPGANIIFGDTAVGCWHTLIRHGSSASKCMCALAPPCCIQTLWRGLCELYTCAGHICMHTPVLFLAARPPSTALHAIRTAMGGDWLSQVLRCGRCRPLDLQRVARGPRWPANAVKRSVAAPTLVHRVGMFIVLEIHPKPRA